MGALPPETLSSAVRAGATRPQCGGPSQPRFSLYRTRSDYRFVIAVLLVTQRESCRRAHGRAGSDMQSPFCFFRTSSLDIPRPLSLSELLQWIAAGGAELDELVL